MKYRACWLCGETKAHKAFAGLHKDECRRCLLSVELLQRRVREEEHHRKINDPLYVLRKRMKSQLYCRTKALNGDVEDVLGYTMSQLMRHLEAKFSPGMSWTHFVKGRIHIDHVVPLNAFREAVTPGEMFSRLWSLENLQPLWARDNLKKSHRLPDDPPRWYAESSGAKVTTQYQ